MSIFNKIYNIPYRIKHTTIKFARWFPVIWNDEDWDHYYVYAILHRKLKNMEDFFSGDKAMALHGVKEAKKIKVCIDLLDRLMEDSYDVGAFKKHHKKWGEPKFNWIDVDDEYCKLRVRQKRVKTEEDKKKERKEFNAACDKETQMRKQDISYLFDMMKKHIECWWD